MFNKSENRDKMKFGLIGKELSHSFSKQFFTQYFETNHIDAEYDNIELTNIEIFKDIIAKDIYCGFNVTNPYKEAIISYLDDITDVAKTIGAVNCIKVINKKNIGYNTDTYGFRMAIEPNLNSSYKNAIVLGSGGASKAVQYTLKELGLDYQVVSRHKNDKTIVYSELTEAVIKSHQIIINTTPIGMFPCVMDFPPLPYQYITQQHFLFDLIYNPQSTFFLDYGKQRGAKTQNGLEMLYYQAIKAIEIFQLKINY